MAIAKVVYKESSEATGQTWMDVTQKTVTSATMLSSITALKNDGTNITGTIATKSVGNLWFSSSTATFGVPTGYYSGTGAIYWTIASKGAETFTPTETAQTISSYRWLTGAQTIAPISSTYVGSGVPTIGATTIYPSTILQSITSEQYLTGAQTFAPVVTTNLEASYIASGITVQVGDSENTSRIANITGTFQGGIPSSALMSLSVVPSDVEQEFPYILVSYPNTVTQSTPISVDTSSLINGNTYLFDGKTKGRKQYDPTYSFNTYVTWNDGFSYQNSDDCIITLTNGYVSTNSANYLEFTLRDVGYSYVNVAPVSLQSKTVTPTESAQTVTADTETQIASLILSDENRTGSKTVSAMSEFAVGDTCIIRGYLAAGSQTLSNKTDISHTFTWTGDNYTYTAGYFTITITSSTFGWSVAAGASGYPYSVDVNGNKNVPIIIAKGSGYIGLSSVLVNAISSTYVGTGVTKKAAATIYPSTAQQTIASQQYLSGVQTFAPVTTLHLESSYIASGITIRVGDTANDSRIANVTGTLQGAESFAKIYKSLAYRSIINSSASLVSEWANSLTVIYAGQFAFPTLEGTFSFENASSIGACAFASVYANGQGGQRPVCSLFFPKVVSMSSTCFAFNWGLSYVEMPIFSSVIQQHTFMSCTRLSNVSIPHCTRISASAFYGCASLEKVVFSECSSVGWAAFYYCSSMSYVSFEQCSYIDTSAFACCTMLASVSFPECSYIGGSAFYSCKALSSVVFPKCNSISTNAFNSCTSLEFASFPLCKFIGQLAFQINSSLASIYAPECETIGSEAFLRCIGLTEISFPKCISVSTGAFSGCYGISKAYFSSCKQLADYAFERCSALTDISFPLLETIGYSAFERCSGLTEIYFPECTTIYENAFKYCSYISNISLPKLTWLRASVFDTISSLKTIYLQECTSVGTYAFRDDKALESAYFMGSSVASAGTNVFYNTPMQYSSYLGYFGSIYVPSSLVDSYKTATNWTQYSNRIVGI